MRDEVMPGLDRLCGAPHRATLEGKHELAATLLEGAARGCTSLD